MRKVPTDVANLFHLLEKSGDGLFYLDRELKVLALNSIATGWFRTTGQLGELKSEGLGIFLSDASLRKLRRHFSHGLPEEPNDCPLVQLRVPSSVSDAGNSANRARNDDLTLEIRLQRIDHDDGNGYGLLGVARDVTGRVSVERALDAARQAAEETSAAKTDILYSVSHDIRTPVNGALGFIELLRKTDLANTQLEYVDTVERSIRSMIEIIDQLLEMARIESGYLDFHPTPVHITELLQNCIQLHQLDADAKSLKLTFRNETNEADAFVQVDAARFNQIINNLLTNAIKFTKTGGIEVRLNISANTRNSRKVEIRVIDTGIGIYPDELERLFKAYEKSQRAVTRRAGGIGLGLAISRRLAEGMGGHIAVESKPNEGSTFKVSLPLLIPVDNIAQTIYTDNGASGNGPPTDRTTAYGNTRSNPTAGVGSPLVLAVDDSDINLTYVTTLLQLHDVRVLSAISGQRAIDLLDQHKPDLILLDIHMPAINGFDVFEACVQRYGKRRPPVVALTADASRELTSDIKHAGFDEVIFKPATEQDFLGVLRRHVGLDIRTAPASSVPADEPGAKSDIDTAFGISMAGGNESLWQQNMAMFSDQLKDMIQSLEQPDIESDRIRVSDISHRIAGTASYLGAGELTHQARKVQDFARRPTDQPLKQPIEELIHVSRNFLSTADTIVRKRSTSIS